MFWGKLVFEVIALSQAGTEGNRKAVLCTLYKPVRSALFADSLTVPLSYRCSTRPKLRRKPQPEKFIGVCLLPTVLMIVLQVMLPKFRKILRREQLLL